MDVKSIPDAVKSDGTKVPYVVGVGYTLGAGTWYIDASLADASTATIHCSWDATAVITSINYQRSNMPAFKSVSRPYTDADQAVDVALNASDATGLWLTKTFAVAPDVIGGTASTTALSTVGGTAGAGEFELVNNGDRRGRTKWVIATGGVVRQHMHGKQA